MPGVEAIGSFSTVATLIDQSIDNYQKAYDYLERVGGLGIVDDSMVIARETPPNRKSTSQVKHESLRGDFYKELNKKIDTCDQKSHELRHLITKSTFEERNHGSRCYSVGLGKMGCEVETYKDVQHWTNNDLIHFSKEARMSESEGNLPKYFNGDKEVQPRFVNQAHGLPNNIYGQQIIGGIQQYRFSKSASRILAASYYCESTC